MIQKLITWWEGWVRMRNLRHMQSLSHRANVQKAELRAELNRDLMRMQRRAARRMNH